jgi:predicted HicB family RNase H-like nuclease
MSVQFSIRLEDDIHAKLRVLSAFQNKSLNAVVTDAMKAHLSQWEQRHGPLPLPPQDTD